MGFVDILLLIVVLVVVGAIGVYYMRMKSTNSMKELVERKDQLLNTDIEDQLFTLKNMQLAGQTKRQYESLLATWQSITNFKFTEIEASLVAAEQYVEQFKYWKAKAAMAEAEETLIDTEEAVDALSVGVLELVEIGQENNEKNDSLLERYNEVKKQVMNHSFAYGPAIETLEKNVHYLELNFSRYNELMSEGDFVEAEKMLTTIESDLSTLEEILEKIPTMYTQIKEEYEDQIKDLKDGYEHMLSEGFMFENEHISEEIDEIQESLNEAKAAIKNADLVEAQTLMDKAERAIHSYYDYMEAEIEAKRYVYEHVGVLKTRMEAVNENNRYTAVEVDRLAQSYILHQHENEEVKSIGQQIQELGSQFQNLLKQVDSEEIVYTKIAKQIEHFEKRINQLDERQAEILESLIELSKREREARSNLDLYELDLRNMKRKIEKHHLPGLRQSYFDIFYKVTDEIEDLSKQLNLVRVDMELVDRKDANLDENLSKLEEMTEQIIDSASLTEFMIQHSNRFRFDHPEMDQAINEAEYLFYEQYNYDKALNVIEKALYRIDQDGPTHVRRMYFQEKQNYTY